MNMYKTMTKMKFMTWAFFPIEVDDSIDINQASQCSIIARYVTSEGILVERFLGFLDFSAARSSQALFNLLDGELLEFS